MPLIATDEQEALRDVMRAFLARYSSEAEVRTAMESLSGYDATAWKTAADQIGVQALAIPEEMGGAGYGFDELAIVMEETGRSLFPAPVLSTTVLATSALVAVGDPVAREYLARIATGDLIATVPCRRLCCTGIWRTSSRTRSNPALIGDCRDPSRTCWTARRLV